MISFYLSGVHWIAKNIMVVLALAALFSCSTRPGTVRKLKNRNVALIRSDTVIEGAGGQAGTVRVLYLGSAGLLLIRNKAAILVDPFFSHQGFGRIGRSVFLGRGHGRTFRPDRKMIQTGIGRIQSALGDSVRLKAILVAHSHYDHLMDVPAVSRHFGGGIPVFLNRTGFNICHQVLDSTAVSVLEQRMTTREVVRDPFIVPLAENLSVHIRPILADHNPHFRHVKFFSGRHTRPENELGDPYQKTRANLWLEGNTFSFLIDFVTSDGTIDYRIFIQSSSCNPPYGIPPPALLTRPVDLAFLGVVSYQFSPEYPCAQLETLAPREIIWVHWEDFFRKYTSRPKTVRGTDIPGFFQLPCVKEYKTGRLMWPGTTIKFKY